MVDAALTDLLHELRDYPAPPGAPIAPSAPNDERDLAGVAVPLQLATGSGVLSFISTTTVFGTPLDITLSEVAIEAFFPADRETADVLNGAGARRRGPSVAA